MMSASASRRPVSVKSRVVQLCWARRWQLVAEDVELAVERVAQDLLLGLDHHLVEGAPAR